MSQPVRDPIPEITRADGGEPQTRVLGDDDYVESLLEKLCEESDELLYAAPRQRLEEAADVYEVFTTLVDMLGLTMEQVQEAARHKREQRGGFAERIWLEVWQLHLEPTGSALGRCRAVTVVDQARDRTSPLR